MPASYIYYNVLKMYKGTLKKTYKGNTHLLIVPITPRKYLYLAVIGQLIDQHGSYACHLVVSIPSRLVDSIISGEEEHFGDRYVIVEKLKCEPQIIGESHYNIALENPEKAKNIKSDLTIEYHPEFNLGSKKIYVVTGELKFETEEISSKGEMGMTAAKQSALMGKKSRFEEPETKQDIKEGQYMENSDKLKVALMGNIQESNLPKKGKLLLLDLVFENEDLGQTLEVLESFAVIDEKTKEKLINEVWADFWSGGIYRLAGRGLRSIFDKCVKECGYTKGISSNIEATGRKMCIAKCKGQLEKLAKIETSKRGKEAKRRGLEGPEE